MDNYISREDAVQCAVDIAADLFNDGSYGAPAGASTVGIWLKNLLAADVRPVVKARWYWDNYKYDWCCSNCFHPADHSIDKDDTYKEPSFKFCPHCGAMTGDNLDTTKGERRDESSGQVRQAKGEHPSDRNYDCGAGDDGTG